MCSSGSSCRTMDTLPSSVLQNSSLCAGTCRTRRFHIPRGLHASSGAVHPLQTCTAWLPSSYRACIFRHQCLADRACTPLPAVKHAVLIIASPLNDPKMQTYAEAEQKPCKAGRGALSEPYTQDAHQRCLLLGTPTSTCT